jgi:hypothetical protein
MYTCEITDTCDRDMKLRWCLILVVVDIQDVEGGWTLKCATHFLGYLFCFEVLGLNTGAHDC